jgi:hypothetical protein
MQFDYGLFNYFYSPGYMWFAILGLGIHMKRLRDHKPLFHERPGGRARYWDCCGWRFRCFAW